MDKQARLALKRSLRRRGFDGCRSFSSGLVKVDCSQCSALVIQGLACHETGCPNQRSRRER